MWGLSGARRTGSRYPHRQEMLCIGENQHDHIPKDDRVSCRLRTHRRRGNAHPDLSFACASLSSVPSSCSSEGGVHWEAAAVRQARVIRESRNPGRGF